MWLVLVLFSVFVLRVFSLDKCAQVNVCEAEFFALEIIIAGFQG